MSLRFETFAVNGNDLQSSSAKVYLITVNTLMKNTLLCALNRIAELAPLVVSQHSLFSSFTDYVAGSAEVICLHLQGDELFFSQLHAQGKNLLDILGTACNPNSTYLQSRLGSLKQKAKEWKIATESYESRELLSMLSFRSELVEVMRRQLDCVRGSEMEKEIEDDVLRAMIQENIQWMSKTSGIAVLLPFILSHHDWSSCSSWPVITPEGRASLPRIIDVHADLWKFAPFHPITKEPQSLVL